MDPNSTGVNRIAFINADGQLCTTAPDGGNTQVLTDDGRFLQFPAWSPDSSMLATIASDRRSSGIVVAKDQPGSARALYEGEDGPPIYLYWSPDSTQVSFIAAEGTTFGMHLAQLDGQRHVCARGQPFFWSFSPDGMSVLAHTNGTGSFGKLQLLPTHEGDVRDLAMPGLFQAPDVHTNGQYFAYAMSDAVESNRLVVTTSEGQNIASLNYQGVVALAWSPREDLLAFIHPSDQVAHWYGSLQLLDLSDNEARVLVDDDVIAFFWSPDGSMIAFLTLGPPRGANRRQDMGSYSSVNANTRSEEPAAEPNQNSVTLSIGVVDLSNDKVRRLARFEPQPLFINQFLPFFDQYSRSHQIWSPDSRAIVMPLMAYGVPKIAVIPSDGSRAQIIAEGSMAFWSTR